MSDRESAATDVLSLVGNDTRADILQALADAYSEAPMDPWMAYGDLQDAVGLRDNGNFNYHLDQLGDLVVKGEGGYRLSRIGMGVVSTVSSGAFDPHREWGPVDAPGSCFRCGEDLHLRYDGGILRVTCGDDDHAIPLSIPPSLLDAWPAESVVEKIAFEEQHWGALTRRGICSECRGRVVGEVEFGGREPEHYHYHGRCQRCGFQHGIPVGLYLLGHPAVIAFYHDHGLDVRTVPFWTLEWCEPGSETVVSTEPLRLRVDVTEEGETLSLTVDGDGQVVSTERSDAS